MAGIPVQFYLMEMSEIQIDGEFFLTLHLKGCILWHRKTKELHETFQGCTACQSQEECP